MYQYVEQGPCVQKYDARLSGHGGPFSADSSGKRGKEFVMEVLCEDAAVGEFRL